MNSISTYKTLVLRLLLVLLSFSFCRGLFFICNQALFENQPCSIAFFRGLPFDVSALLYINLPFIVVSILPFKFVRQKNSQALLKAWFLLTNGLALILNLIDIPFFRFTGRRMDFSILSLSTDIRDQSFQLLWNYSYVALIITGLIIAIYRLYPHLAMTDQVEKKVVSFTKALAFLALILLGMRGGMQLKPIMPLTAFKYTDSSVCANAILNTPFVFLHSLAKEPVQVKDWFDDSEINRLLSKNNLTLGIEPDSIPQNIVILILESFAGEYVGHLNEGEGYTPFLDRLADRGIGFQHHFANSRTSAESISAILAGVPNLMQGAIHQSKYQANDFPSIVNELRDTGYSAHFFHGGKNGTMNFDLFANKLGFTYYGMDEYPNKKDFDGTWGIFDEPYFEYCAAQLNTINQPFISVIYSLSSHQPYTIPEPYEQVFNKSDKAIHNAVRYSDHALERFFKVSENTDWYQNTLFIITADHCAQIFKPENQKLLPYYRIPLVFYHPRKTLNPIPDQISQQADIPVSIAEFSGISKASIPGFGQSVFSQGEEKGAIFYENEMYYLVKNGYYVKMVDDTVLGPYHWRTDSLMNNDSLLEKAGFELKALVQYFNNGLIRNSFEH